MPKDNTNIELNSPSFLNCVKPYFMSNIEAEINTNMSIVAIKNKYFFFKEHGEG